jgi:transcription antitermination factor NusG
MEHVMEHREHGANGGVAVQNRVDMGAGDGVTVRDGALGALHPECGSNSRGSAEFKFAHGGARAGAGRKPKPVSVALLAPGLEGPRWYVAEVTRGAEAAIAWALCEVGFVAVAPGYLAHVPADPVRRRAAADVLRPAFPGYILVELDRRNAGWRAVCHQRGVRRLIGADAERPTPVTWQQAAWVLAQFGPDGVQRRPAVAAALVPLPVGVRVRVVEGLGEGQAGTVLASDGRAVVLEVGGRRVRVAQAAVAVCG